MSEMSPKHNLLFGLLALQNGFITPDQLITALGRWTKDKSLQLDQILLSDGAFDDPTRELLIALTAAHLAQHGNDPQQSLAALSSIDDVRQALEQVQDEDLQDGLQLLSTLSYHAADEDATGVSSVDSLAAPATRSAGDQRFRVLRPHARGGLGEIFVAVDAELQREVALKEIQTRYADDRHNRERFVREAEITGRLEHPSIVPVYGLGTYADGRPFYAMKFIRGDSLGEAIDVYHGGSGDDGEKPLQLRQLLQRFIDICEAMQYAHDRGVLHRDLKPGNIMLGRYGETLVVDWGLAKSIGKNESSSPEPILIPASGTSDETLPGSTVGTPAYMSPEQAAGKLDQLGPASDIYSLGATLYQVLTGVVPFKGRLREVVRQVVEGRFRPPREQDPSIPRSLEAICLKAMSLLPEDRYPSAKSMAEEVEHWLAEASDEAARLRRSLYAAQMNLLQVAWRIDNIARVHELLDATRPVGDREDLRGFEWYFYNCRSHAEVRTIRGENDSWIPLSEGLAFQNESLLISLCHDSTVRSWDLAEAEPFDSDLLSVASSHIGASEELDGNAPIDSKHVAAAISTDGSRIVRASAEQSAASEISVKLAIENWTGGKTSVSLKQDSTRHDLTPWSWLPDRVACNQAGTAVAFSNHRGELIIWQIDKTSGWVRKLYHTLFGRRFESSEKSSSEHYRVIDAGGKTACLSFSPDGRWLASANHDGFVKVWDAVKGKLRFSVKGHTAEARTVAFSRDGKALVSGGLDDNVHVWDASTGESLQTLRGHQSQVASVAFGVTNARVATGDGNGIIIIWDTTSGQKVVTLRGHTDQVSQLAFNPKGTLLASSSSVIKIWSLDEARSLEKTLPHNTQDEFRVLDLFQSQASVNSVSFSRDGSIIASAGSDAVIKLWNTATGAVNRTFSDHTNCVLGTCFSNDGKWLASGGSDGLVMIRDMQTGLVTQSFQAHDPTVSGGVSLNPAGTQVVSGGHDNLAKVWDLSSGDLLFQFTGHTKPLECALFSPDGRTIATCSWDGTIKLWDAATGQGLRSISAESGEVYACAFHPEGHLLASVGHDLSVRIWNIATGQQVHVLRGARSMCQCLTFSRDGKRVVAGDFVGKLTSWDISTGQEVMSLELEDSIHSLAFNLNQTGLAAGLGNGTVRLWSWDV